MNKENINTHNQTNVTKTRNHSKTGSAVKSGLDSSNKKPKESGLNSSTSSVASRQSKIRKFSTVRKEKESIPKYVSISKKLQDIYLTCRSNTSSTWKFEFKTLMEKENIIDFSASDFIPISKNLVGSYIMKLEVLWYIWLELIKRELEIAGLIRYMNKSLDYIEVDSAIGHRDPEVIVRKYNDLMKRFEKDDIVKYCQANGRDYMEDKDHSYLLDYIFMKKESSKKNSLSFVTIIETSRDESEIKNRVSNVYKSIDYSPSESRRTFVVSDTNSAEKYNRQIDELVKSIEKLKNGSKPSLRVMTEENKLNDRGEESVLVDKLRTSLNLGGNEIEDYCEVSFRRFSNDNNNIQFTTVFEQQPKPEVIVTPKKVDSVRINLSKSSQQTSSNRSVDLNVSNSDDEGPCRDRTRYKRSFSQTKPKKSISKWRSRTPGRLFK
jgi:hypothetical protein